MRKIYVDAQTKLHVLSLFIREQHMKYNYPEPSRYQGLTMERSQRFVNIYCWFMKSRFL